MASYTYFFIFGRTPKLAFLELCAFFPDATLITFEIGMIQVEAPLDSKKWIGVLGGTIKIAQFHKNTTTLDALTLTSVIDKDLDHRTFGVSVYGTVVLPKNLLSDMKEILETDGQPVRYVTPHDGQQLTSVVLDKKQVYEIDVIQDGDVYQLAHTIAVQEYESWNNRDWGRPYADAKSGMLPIKVSRMIVNIAIGQSDASGDTYQKTVYDPFCGMGSVISEAFVVGARVLGSDVASEVVSKCKKNLEWIESKYPDSRGDVAKIFHCDAVHASSMIAPRSVHAIVTEPFMGSTSIVNNMHSSPLKVKNIIKGLEKLYIGCLKDWHNVLSPGGMIVMALPSYTLSHRVYFVKKVVDMCESLGYTTLDGPIEYSRPNAVVHRNFYILKKI